MESLYKYLQRATTKVRLDGLKKYIEERFGPDAFAIGAFFARYALCLISGHGDGAGARVIGAPVLAGSSRSKIGASL